MRRIVYRLPLILGLATAVVVLVTYLQIHGIPSDARAYWIDPSDPYASSTWLFLYSPPAADFFALFQGLGFDAFVALVRGGEVIALAWFTGPLLPLAVFLPPVASEINAGNINMMLAACVVLGMRWPVFWVPVLLTKPTMGIGLLWFVAQRDWRKLAVAIGVTGAIVAVSVLVQPSAWVAYINMLIHADPAPGWPFPWTVVQRAVVFVPLLLWGCWTKRPWAVVLASLLAAPRLYYISIAMLLALSRVRSEPRAQQDGPFGLALWKRVSDNSHVRERLLRQPEGRSG